MIKTLSILVLVALTCLAATAQTNKSETRAVAEVRKVLDEQVAAWNNGSITGFMQGYWNSPETTFVSGDTVTRGWATVLERYQRRYDSREKMGNLSFEEITIQPLDKRSALATGRWSLQRASDNPKGRFTLLLKKTKDGWRIVHDHTS